MSRRTVPVGVVVKKPDQFADTIIGIVLCPVAHLQIKDRIFD